MPDKFHFMPDKFHLMPDPTHQLHRGGSLLWVAE
jgi:hypothetical protein